MATLLTRNEKNTDSSLVFFNINWLQFKTIEEAFNNIPGVRLVYLDNVLEIMNLSQQFSLWTELEKKAIMV